MQQSSGGKRSTLPEYLEAGEMTALIEQAPTPTARLLMLIQWRAGLRVSEALALEAQDVTFAGDHPVLRVRQGKGNRDRLVPLHAELAAALRLAIDYREMRQETRFFSVDRSTAYRWLVAAVDRAVDLGVLAPGRRIGTHTLRHSFARHLLAHGIPINYLSRWLGHASLQTTLVYLELLPDPSGSMEAIP